MALYPDASRKDGFIVLSEVMHPDGTPHSTNMRATIENDPDLWVGFEQEYFLYQGWASSRLSQRRPPQHSQGPYYCGVGYKYMGDMARTIVEEHLDLCLAAGINHEGINAEVAKGQWEFQIFAKGSAKAADDTWTARYLMMRLVREIRSGCRAVLQADQGRLERLGHAHQLLDQVHARNGRQGISRIPHEGVREVHSRAHRRVWSRITICV